MRLVVLTIAVSISAVKGGRESCFAAGYTAHLTKPIRQEILLQKITEHSRVARANGGSAADISPDAKLRLSDAAQTFLRNCGRNLVTMREDLERLDLVAVAFLGHRMRGAGGMFGFPIITDIGGALEDAADRGDARESQRCLDALSRYLDEAGAEAAKDARSAT